MSEITVKGFAEQIGVPPETLLRQLGSAGIEEKQPDDVLSDEEKEQLFRYLRSSHGATDEGAARRKITLKPKSPTEKMSGRCRLKIKNISAAQLPIPLTAVNCP